MTAARGVTRRRFLENAARGTAVGVGLGAAAAAGVSPSRVLGANDRLALGLIGSGGRGRGVMRTFKSQGTACVAVCDINEANLEAGAKAASPGAKTYEDYRRLLDRKDIPLVLIATPEHWHCPMLVDAVHAGKDVYCEKPMSHSIEEGAATVEKVRQTDRVVQIGMQRRSSPIVLKAKAVIDDGTLGSIYEVDARWNWNIARTLDNSPFPRKVDWKKFRGPRSKMEYQPMYVRYWRYFWDFSGGNCTDQGTHLMDVVRWFMKSPPPKAAVCYGDVYEMKGAETPDVFSAVYEYPGFLATWTLNYDSAINDSWSITFHGRKAAMVLNREGFRVFRGRETLKTGAGGLPTDPHVKNFLDCVRSRKDPNATVEVGHLAVCGPHLANIALRKKTRAVLNADATKATVAPWL